ncbi:MAG: ribonuclease P protein component [Psychroflexus sp.]|nr:ribonuclease P protein component [Psychroflexus sp.]MDR9447903.1 ribonuclease P protein component [Psychroflexus sp.]
MIRLKSKKNISLLFSKSRQLKAYPLRLVYIKTDRDDTEIGVSVPKKKVTLAVNRNRLKRQMREAIRLQDKAIVQLKSNYKMMWIYTGNTSTCDFHTIQNAVRVITEKMSAYEK